MGTPGKRQLTNDQAIRPDARTVLGEKFRSALMTFYRSILKKQWIGIMITTTYNNQTKQIHWVCSVCGFKWISTVKRKNLCPQCRQAKKVINVYTANDFLFFRSFNSLKELCIFFGLDYKKQHGNISSICNRKQKTLLGKYILRYAYDDE